MDPMSKLTLTVEDDVFETLKADAALPRAKTVEQEAAHRLKRFADVNRSKRVLVIPSDLRQQLEAIIGASIGDAADLVRQVKNLSCVKIGLIERPLTDGESIRLREQAAFHGQDPDTYAKLVIEEVFARLFDRF